MKEFSYMVAGFCAATGLIDLLAGHPVMGGLLLFMAVVNFKLAGLHE